LGKTPALHDIGTKGKENPANQDGQPQGEGSVHWSVITLTPYFFTQLSGSRQWGRENTHPSRCHPLLEAVFGCHLPSSNP
jgi:hypothetical protein